MGQKFLTERTFRNRRYSFEVVARHDSADIIYAVCSITSPYVLSKSYKFIIATPSVVIGFTMSEDGL